MSDLIARLRAAASYRMDESLPAKFAEYASLIRHQADLLNEAAEEIARLNGESRGVIARIEKLEAFVNGVHDI